ncbi:Protein peste [Blattella germanica]|nr:Protein peste [Blattella germanica]
MKRCGYLKWISGALLCIGVILTFTWNNIYDYMIKKHIVHFVIGNWEVHEKVNITWNENNTVTYKQLKRWYFDPENSKGSLEDNVTMLNVLPVSAAYVSRYWSNFLVYPLAAALKIVEKTVWVSKTVGEHLFDGYTDPLLSIANSLPGFASMELPADKIGFFYGRNGSSDYEGALNMDTGALDSSNLGVLRTWKDRNVSDYFEGECSRIKGSAGDFFPRELTRDQEWSMFATELCKHGAPGFVSYPHFLDADPYYLNRISGLNPDPERHSFQVTLEPTLGIPLDVTARLQINLLLQPIERISLLENVPFLMSPVMWFEDRATIPPDLARKLQMVLYLSKAGQYFSIGILVLGIILFALSVLPDVLRRQTSPIPVTIIRKGTGATEVVLSKADLRSLEKEENEEEESLLRNKKCEV